MLACAHCPSRKSGPFAPLGSNQLYELDLLKTVRIYQAKRTIFEEEQQPTFVYCLTRGYVKIEKLDPRGDPVALDIAGPGMLLGVSAVLSGSEHSHSAVALSEVTGCLFPASTLVAYAKISPEVAFSFLHDSIRLIRFLEEEVIARTRLPAQERIARLLKRFNGASEQSRDGNPRPLIPEVIGRSELAGLAGLVPETVSRALSEVRPRGINNNYPMSSNHVSRNQNIPATIQQIVT